jgi:hypothetical protein
MGRAGDAHGAVSLAADRGLVAARGALVAREAASLWLELTRGAVAAVGGAWSVAEAASCARLARTGAAAPCRGIECGRWAEMDDAQLAVGAGGALRCARNIAARGRVDAVGAHGRGALGGSGSGMRRVRGTAEAGRAVAAAARHWLMAARRTLVAAETAGILLVVTSGAFGAQRRARAAVGSAGRAQLARLGSIAARGRIEAAGRTVAPRTHTNNNHSEAGAMSSSDRDVHAG